MTLDGSDLRGEDGLSPRAVMECQICWTPYDPELGDDFRRIEPGTPFTGLPADWSCPNCAAPKQEFLVREDPGAESESAARAIRLRAAQLVEGIAAVQRTAMDDSPTLNPALQVQAVGFRRHGERLVGVLIAPWFMSLVLLPSETEDWFGLEPGTREYIPFPSGDYEFEHQVRPETGGYKSCSLFLSMHDFTSQAQAVAVAEAVLTALYDPDTSAGAPHDAPRDEALKDTATVPTARFLQRKG